MVEASTNWTPVLSIKRNFDENWFFFAETYKNNKKMNIYIQLISKNRQIVVVCILRFYVISTALRRRRSNVSPYFYSKQSFLET